MIHDYWHDAHHLKYIVFVTVIRFTHHCFDHLYDSLFLLYFIQVNEERALAKDRRHLLSRRRRPSHQSRQP